ncbi:FMN-dependent NADH-azoreductase [Hazenella coriacea]|uniref:FMN dependent NADH:quinone oxidoreductase n=1 Tax=Hazenella coriacea TaxID=1179467 RepID=A0A4R3LG27_9BACL|nr:FMN-dependent NADH-azoreductase [Hazenella coriacea]TCS96446.1 FMN-dependent NADH-azoreductase [Hazenella coriacea]
MSKVLYITANPKAESESFSLRLGQAFLNQYKELNPQDEIIELDLYNTDIPNIDADVFQGWGKLASGNELNEIEQQKVARLNELLDQFISADKYVFVTPMWNFNFPPRFKSYIDTFCIAGKTFKYTPEGPVGLMTGKKAVHIHARGGIYSEGPNKNSDFADSYLRTILQFIGITDIESVIAEGMAYTPDQAEVIMEKALAHAKEAATQFAK